MNKSVNMSKNNETKINEGVLKIITRKKIQLGTSKNIAPKHISLILQASLSLKQI